MDTAQRDEQPSAQSASGICINISSPGAAKVASRDYIEVHIHLDASKRAEEAEIAAVGKIVTQAIEGAREA